MTIRSAISLEPDAPASQVVRELADTKVVVTSGGFPGIRVTSEVDA